MFCFKLLKSWRWQKMFFFFSRTNYATFHFWTLMMAFREQMYKFATLFLSWKPNFVFFIRRDRSEIFLCQSMLYFLYSHESCPYPVRLFLYLQSLGLIQVDSRRRRVLDEVLVTWTLSFDRWCAFSSFRLSDPVIGAFLILNWKRMNSNAYIDIQYCMQYQGQAHLHI